MKKNSKLFVEKTYIAPDIEVLDIVIEQNILSDGSGNLPGMEGSDW